MVGLCFWCLKKLWVPAEVVHVQSPLWQNTQVVPKKHRRWCQSTAVTVQPFLAKSFLIMKERLKWKLQFLFQPADHKAKHRMQKGGHESCNSCPLLKGAGEGLAERHQKAKGNWRSLRGEQGSMKNPMLFWNTESKLLFSKIDRCTREMQESLD